MQSSTDIIYLIIFVRVRKFLFIETRCRIELYIRQKFKQVLDEFFLLYFTRCYL